MRDGPGPARAASGPSAETLQGRRRIGRSSAEAVPAPPTGDLWPLLPACVPAAIQVN